MVIKAASACMVVEKRIQDREGGGRQMDSPENTWEIELQQAWLDAELHGRVDRGCAPYAALDMAVLSIYEAYASAFTPCRSLEYAAVHCVCVGH